MKTEERNDAYPEHLIYVENQSTVPITIFSVGLVSCENVNVVCGMRPSNQHVDAGSRALVVRVRAKNTEQGFTYRFRFSYRVDSGQAAVVALAQAGDTAARKRVEAQAHYDSLLKSEKGTHYNELSADDFKALAGKAVAVRAEPESLSLAPGATVSTESLRLLLLDSTGHVLGQTHWIGWGGLMMSGPVQSVPPHTLRARRVGRAELRLYLADAAQERLGTHIDQAVVPINVAYPIEPHAPLFMGRAVDADVVVPLRCLWVALEDSAEDIVARGVTGADGAFSLQAPRAGTYRVRMEMPGWTSVAGAAATGADDEANQREYRVRFTDQTPGFFAYEQSLHLEHARPISFRYTPQPYTARANGQGAPVIRGVSIAGSETLPIVNIITPSVPAGTTWAQFVVDTAGAVDRTSILLPVATTEPARAAVMTMLPQVTFKVARLEGRPSCEMLRVQVNFSPR